MLDISHLRCWINEREWVSERVNMSEYTFGLRTNKCAMFVVVAFLMVLNRKAMNGRKGHIKATSKIGLLEYKPRYLVYIFEMSTPHHGLKTWKVPKKIGIVWAIFSL